MLVLGIDPGLTRCGVGVVESRPKPQLVEYSVIRTSKDADTAHRLLAIEQELDAAIQRIKPDAVAVERAFAQHNLHSVAGTIQASGIGMMVAARHQIPVSLYTPSEVKAAVTGSGRADKAQIGKMVVRILGLAEVPKPADSADAIALAICHIFRGQATNRYAQALANQRRKL